MRTVTFAITLVTLLASAAHAAPVAEWTFNEYDGDARRIPAASGGGEIVMTESWGEASLSSPKGSKLNAPGEADAGSALGLSGQARNGDFLDIRIPPVGSTPMTLSAAVRRSGTGFTSVVISVSSDEGKTFKKIKTWKPGTSWAIQEATLPATGSAGTRLVRITVDGASSARGGIRIDNLVVVDSVPSTPTMPGT